MESKLRQFAVQLYEAGALKLGTFTLKSGAISPFYVDLRNVVCSTEMHMFVAELLRELIVSKKLESQILCGVPYTALPLATLVATKLGQNMVIRRKEAKAYGLKNLIEGVKDGMAGQKCLVIEDLISSGASIVETVSDLEASGFIVKDAVVILNREQGGVANLEKKNINVHALFTISEIVDMLLLEKKIEESVVTTVKEYIKTGQIPLKISPELSLSGDRLKLSFEKRKQFAKSAAAASLFDIMVAKNSNLCVAADVPTAEKLLEITKLVGPYICVLKTHHDIVDNFTDDTAVELQKLAKKFNFLIMEDRKFAEIGSIALKQASKVAGWADLVTAHSNAGPDIVPALRSAFSTCPEGDKKGVFLVAEMSSKGNLHSPEYAKATANMAILYPEVVSGLVCQSPSVVPSLGVLQLTPGVNLETKGDSLGQQYNTPEVVVGEKGADIAVVGRGIVSVSDPAAAAQKYQTLLWQAYLNRLA
ncbi:unnamed protein product [Bemisia tabaci]|uniref:Uridine 5'-monophosphate synthase n=1 Tax=Bemisia tabaci TaxID=7038 RepID=A0A9P0AK12_BEMTA|nr:unnamed protein product [Bemisia tabaci]